MHYRPGKLWRLALDQLVGRPRAAAIAATLLTALFVAAIRPPVIEGSMVDQISGNNAQLELARRIQAASGDLTSAAVIVEPKSVTIAAVFADIGELRERLAGIDPAASLRSVDSAREQLFVYDLAPEAPIAELLVALRDHPDAGAIVSTDATRFLYVLTLPEAAEDSVLDAIVGHDWSAVYATHLILAGAQLERDIAAALQQDLSLLIPTIVVTMLFALFVAFRRWRALFLPIFASIASTMVTFALFSVTDTPINLVTLLALPIVLIVGLANSCHFLARCGADLDVAGNAAAAVRITLRRVGPPFFFSSLTTAIALASLSLNDVPPIASLGRIAAATLLVVFVLVMLAAPLSLRWYLDGFTRSWHASGAFAFLSARLAAWRGPVSVAMLLGLALGAVALPFLSVQSNPRAFFPDHAEFSAAQRAFERDFYVFSPLRLLVSVDERAGNGLFALRQAGALRDSLAEHAGVRQVMLQPAAASRSDYILTALLARDADLPEVIAFVDAARATLPPGVDVVYSSASLVYEDIDRQAMNSLLESLGWSIALIFGAILMVFRSVRVVLATMLANAVPLMLVCAAIWLVDRPLNLVTVFVFFVALGVIVDDAIHILFSRAAGDRLAGSSIEFSVLLSTAMLCLGLLLCQFSDFPTTREFAAYCALALIGAVVSNLTVLPQALRRLGSKSPPSDVEIGDG